MTSGHPAPHKPAELFRADLISAMKLPDSMPLESGSFFTIKEPWRTEWEVGVQVCVSPDHILGASTRTIKNPPVPPDEVECSEHYIHENDVSNDYVMYDLDELDLNWLQSVNTKRKFRALASGRGLEEDTLREALLTLETKCQQSMARAVATEETLGIEYDEQTTCDVCRDHESEDTNDMIFCDSCNVCVHQACYGVATIPKGEWLCKACSIGDEQASCVLCPVKGGALKRVRPGNSSWAHLCCALWIPEVRVGNADKMEPITNLDAIPLGRRNLVCCICKRRIGACIKCTDPLCVIAYHVTCGFQQGLDMKSKLDMATNTVIHQSYCPKHTVMRKSPTKQRITTTAALPQGSSNNHHMTRPSQLVQLQESFYNHASPEDLATKLKLPLKQSTLVYNYWKLKRKSQHNRPLLSHLPIETSLESIKAELAAGGIKYGEDVDENFLKVVHLRHNLEKARNLIYMVQKRERSKKQLLLMQWEMLKMKASLAPPRGISTAGAETANSITLEDRSSSSEFESSSDVDAPTPRRTRSMTQQAGSSSSPLGHSPTTPTLNNIDHQPAHENHTPSSHFPPSPPEVSAVTNGPHSAAAAVVVHHPKQRIKIRTGIKIRTADRASRLDASLSGGNLLRRELRGIAKPDSLDPLAMDDTLQKVQILSSLSVGGATNGSLKPAFNGSMIAKKSGASLDSRALATSNHKVDSEVGGVGAARSMARLLVAEDSHVLRSRTASSPRVRPYVVNHRLADRSS